MRACRNCRYITYGNEKACPQCQGELTEKFSGMVVVLDHERSEVAKVVKLTAPGTYAIRIK
jgi:DNA-directed RNA polymerase subunit E"